MQRGLLGLFLFLILLTTSCGGGGVGDCLCACTCTTENCIINNRTDLGTDTLDGLYTESECEEAGKSGGNLCGGLSDGSVTCTSSWDG